MDTSPFASWRWIDTFSHINVFIDGFYLTLSVSILALSIAVILGIIHALMATSKIMILQIWARIYVEFFQNTPLLITLFFLYYVLPQIPLIGITLDVFFIGVLGIGTYHGAYMSEVFRSGIQAIPNGQFEAASSYGFTYFQKMIYIILPQTIIIVLPPCANQAINLIKNTSVLAIIAGAEIMYNADSYAQSSLNYAPAYVIAGIFYFSTCYFLAIFMRRWEQKLKRKYNAR